MSSEPGVVVYLVKPDKQESVYRVMRIGEPLILHGRAVAQEVGRLRGMRALEALKRAAMHDGGILPYIEGQCLENLILNQKLDDQEKDASPGGIPQDPRVTRARDGLELVAGGSWRASGDSDCGSWRRRPLTASQVVRAAIGLETGGRGPAAGESTSEHVARMADRVVDLLEHNGMLVKGDS